MLLHHSLRGFQKIVKKINKLEPVMSQLTDEEMKEKTEEFKKRYQNGTSLDKLLPEAFALVKESAKRTLGYSHYDVQLIGGIALHKGLLAEMKTGEGKTLVSTTAAYLNALTGKGVHIVTVNDYLAERDAEWMGQIHRKLGLTVGCVLNGMTGDMRKKAYACDITYVTNNELGFDYLRDNMAQTLDQMVLRGLHYCIIDETDSVLIDEARTPLIISGAGSKVSKLYQLCDVLAKQMIKGKASATFSKAKAYIGEEIEETGDFIVDEDNRTVILTADGIAKVEKFFRLDNFADAKNIDIHHHIQLALQAHYLMKRDVDYIVRKGEVMIVDTFTGRIMEGRRYSDGLHQAIEAKEHVKINEENITQATITLQNFFNMYEKKSGMTGTAATEKKEFCETYHMDVFKIPTNRPVIRKDLPDRIYKTENEKYTAVVEEIKAAHEKNQPVLVGTISIEVSERLSKMLKRERINHQMLNAKFDKEEADIVAKAGGLGMVTIATNMAGRGTDIKIPDESKEVGGLKVIGTERHESKRIDDQLRGRSGRQGDPGESCFFVSLEDDLVKWNGNEKVLENLKKKELESNTQITDKRAEALVNNAQSKVEMDHYGARENLLQYDFIDHQHRESIYARRMAILQSENLHQEILAMIREVVAEKVSTVLNEKPAKTKEEPKEESKENKKGIDYEKLDIAVGRFVDSDVNEENYPGKHKKNLIRKFSDDAAVHYEAIVNAIGNPERFLSVERSISLRVLDSAWVNHLSDMEKLREVVRYQAIGQKDPLIEYRTEASIMYEEMLHAIKTNTVETLAGIQQRK